jgi:hypothetical protein
MSFGWWTILDTHTVEQEKPSSVAILDTLKLVRLAPTTIPRSKGTEIFSLAHLLNCLKA